MSERARAFWAFLDRIGWVVTLLFLAVGFIVVHNQGQAIHHQASQIGHQARDLKSQVNREATSRQAQTAATIRARLTNCESGNDLRKGLRVNVETQQKNLPIFLHLLPQFDTAQVREINRQQVAYQLHAFRPLNCKKYSEEILPGHTPSRPVKRRSHRPVDTPLSVAGKSSHDRRKR